MSGAGNGGLLASGPGASVGAATEPPKPPGLLAAGRGAAAAAAAAAAAPPTPLASSCPAAETVGGEEVAAAIIASACWVPPAAEAAALESWSLAAAREVAAARAVTGCAFRPVIPLPAVTTHCELGARPLNASPEAEAAWLVAGTAVASRWWTLRACAVLGRASFAAAWSGGCCAGARVRLCSAVAVARASSARNSAVVTVEAPGTSGAGNSG
ncbi:hypothetical protein V8C86DRAFT_2934019 [Haematococcus lacustris]